MMKFIVFLNTGLIAFANSAFAHPGNHQGAFQENWSHHLTSWFYLGVLIGVVAGVLFFVMAHHKEKNDSCS